MYFISYKFIVFIFIVVVSKTRLIKPSLSCSLRHLSNAEVRTLTQWRGLKLLQDAQRFRTLMPGDVSLPLEAPPKALPAICQQLATKAPLYAAIVIEQGLYPWQEQFLERFDIEGVIQTTLENQVLDIKRVVKQAVFSEWERSFSFDNLLNLSDKLAETMGANHG